LHFLLKKFAQVKKKQYFCSVKTQQSVNLFNVQCKKSMSMSAFQAFYEDYKNELRQSSNNVGYYENNNYHGYYCDHIVSRDALCNTHVFDI